MTDLDCAAAAMRFLADGLAHEHDPDEIGRFVLADPKAAGLCLALAINALRGVLIDLETTEGVDALAVYVNRLRWDELTRLSGMDA